MKKPQKLDTIPALGPYEYLISRAAGVGGTDFQQIKTIETAISMIPSLSIH